MKRLIIATLSGVLFGLVCYGFASRSQEALCGATEPGLSDSTFVRHFVAAQASAQKNWQPPFSRLCVTLIGLPDMS